MARGPCRPSVARYTNLRISWICVTTTLYRVFLHKVTRQHLLVYYSHLNHRHTHVLLLPRINLSLVHLLCFIVIDSQLSVMIYTFGNNRLHILTCVIHIKKISCKTYWRHSLATHTSNLLPDFKTKLKTVIVLLVNMLKICWVKHRSTGHISKFIYLYILYITCSQCKCQRVFIRTKMVIDFAGYKRSQLPVIKLVIFI